MEVRASRREDKKSKNKCTERNKQPYAERTYEICFNLIKMQT